MENVIGVVGILLFLGRMGGWRSIFVRIWEVRAGMRKAYVCAHSVFVTEAKPKLLFNSLKVRWLEYY